MLTQRDLDVLRFVGEMYVVPMSVLGRVLDPCGELRPGSVETVARRVAGRLEQLGYADRRPILGQTWLVPSRRGLRAAGLEYDAGLPALILLDHMATVARLRLYLARHYPEAVWESERAIRSRWAGTGARVRRADGGLLWPDDTATGIEVELTVKQPGRYASAVADTDPTWSDGVWWFTRAADVARLRARLADAGASNFEVSELPEGVLS